MDNHVLPTFLENVQPQALRPGAAGHAGTGKLNADPRHPGSMRPLLAFGLPLLLALAGCAGTAGDDEGLTSSTYAMHLEGMPDGPVAPGATFNVTVQGRMGAGMGMHRMLTDHVGAHFWNRSAMDPTAMLGNATTCSHGAGEMPMEVQATCRAPMEPGTYYLRAHARMPGDDGMHHYWGDERTFTVAAP